MDFFPVHLFNSIRLVCSNCFKSYQSLSFCVIILLASCSLTSFLVLFFPTFSFSSFLHQFLQLHMTFSKFVISEVTLLVLPLFDAMILPSHCCCCLTVYILTVLFSPLHVDQLMSVHKSAAGRHTPPEPRKICQLQH